MHISEYKTYFLTVVHLLNLHPVNSLSLDSMISKISTSYQINFRLIHRNSISSFPLNSNLPSDIFPITISFAKSKGNHDIARVQKEAYYFVPAKRYSSQKIKIFITFAHNIRDLSYIIAKSGYRIGPNYNVLFYNIAPLKCTVSDEVEHQNSPFSRLGFTCPLTFITLNSYSYTKHLYEDVDMIAFVRQLCYLCPVGDRLVKLLELSMIQNPRQIVKLHSKLSSNGYGGAIGFHQIRDHFATERQISKNPRLANCQKYFDSELSCQVAYPVNEIVKERLNASMEGKNNTNPVILHRKIIRVSRSFVFLGGFAYLKLDE